MEQNRKKSGSNGKFVIFKRINLIIGKNENVKSFEKEQSEMKFMDLAKGIPEMVQNKNQICTVQTLFLSVLHLANEHNLFLQAVGDESTDFMINIYT